MCKCTPFLGRSGSLLVWALGRLVFPGGKLRRGLQLVCIVRRLQKLSLPT